MRKITADYVYVIDQDPIQEGVVLVNQQGVIIDVVDRSQIESSELEVYTGIICPGFVNAHCHLELSHLESQIVRGEGMIAFIQDLIQKRIQPQEIIQEAIIKADLQMQREGIVAVGDIVNSNHTVKIKKESPIQYYSFVELFGADASKSNFLIEEGYKLLDEFDHASITAHAPYSLSPQLFQEIKKKVEEDKTPFSIHNQESLAEHDLFHSKTGDFINFYKGLGIELKHILKNGNGSIFFLKSFLPKNVSIQLVHNTYTQKKDLDLLEKVFFCFCPNANLYIENRLPDYSLFENYKNYITIGTDSLASNDQLSIVNELNIILKNSKFSVAEVLKFATLNGATFLKVNNVAGSITQGKKPGLNNLIITKQGTLEGLKKIL